MVSSSGTFVKSAVRLHVEDHFRRLGGAGFSQQTGKHQRLCTDLWIEVSTSCLAIWLESNCKFQLPYARM